MILSAVLMIYWLNCTEGGTDDSLSSSDDLFNFLDFPLICAPNQTTMGERIAMKQLHVLELVVNGWHVHAPCEKIFLKQILSHGSKI